MTDVVSDIAKLQVAAYVVKRRKIGHRQEQAAEQHIYIWR
jgi:hypothetical protein